MTVTAGDLGECGGHAPPCCPGKYLFAKRVTTAHPTTVWELAHPWAASRLSFPSLSTWGPASLTTRFSLQSKIRSDIGLLRATREELHELVIPYTVDIRRVSREMRQGTQWKQAAMAPDWSRSLSIRWLKTFFKKWESLVPGAAFTATPPDTVFPCPGWVF